MFSLLMLSINSSSAAIIKMRNCDTAKGVKLYY